MNRIRGFEGSRVRGFEDSRIKGLKDLSEKLKNYKDLKVWQRSYQLCLQIYKITKGFPDEEKYGLTSQLRRAAVSVPSNVSEGYGRKTTPEYIQFLYIAYGSICEIETQILLSGDLGYIEPGRLEVLNEGVKEVERMLKRLIKSLERKISTP
jgi:four helix bundle protein